MSTTEAKVDKTSGTLAERFSAYPETVKGHSDIGLLVRSFELALRAANKSPKTIKSYTDSVRGFCMLLADSGMPTNVRNLTREHVETYIAMQLEHIRQSQPEVLAHLAE